MEVRKASPTVFFKINPVKTGVYSKSSNSSEFNPVLQKFYEVICEIIIYKKLGGIFLIFCLSSFINNFIVKNSFSEL